MRGPRRRRRRQPAASRGSETDGDGLVEQHPLDAEIEVLAAAEPDGGADDVAGELPQGRVELVDGEVEEAPRGGDAVLGVCELDRGRGNAPTPAARGSARRRSRAK